MLRSVDAAPWRLIAQSELLSCCCLSQPPRWAALPLPPCAHSATIEPPVDLVYNQALFFPNPLHTSNPCAPPRRPPVSPLLRICRRLCVVSLACVAAA